MASDAITIRESEGMIHITMSKEGGGPDVNTGLGLLQALEGVDCALFPIDAFPVFKTLRDQLRELFNTTPPKLP